jgi:hypothetical protein
MIKNTTILHLPKHKSNDSIRCSSAGRWWFREVVLVRSDDYQFQVPVCTTKPYGLPSHVGGCDRTINNNNNNTHYIMCTEAQRQWMGNKLETSPIRKPHTYFKFLPTWNCMTYFKTGLKVTMTKSPRSAVAHQRALTWRQYFFRKFCLVVVAVYLFCFVRARASSSQ